MKRCTLPAALIAASTVLHPARAAAQGAVPPLSQSLSGEAQSAYTSARLLFANGDFAGALAKFDQAFQRSADPRLLYDMAICEKNLRHYARMQADLLRYEKDAGWTLVGGEKKTVDDALAAIKNLVGAVHVAVNVAGAEIRVDDEAAGASPLTQPLMLDLGKHRIAATKPGFAPQSKEVVVDGGGEVTVTFDLVPQTEASRLVVSTGPKATISIDGNAVAVGHFEGSEAPGSHEVTVTEAGMKPYRSEIDLRDGERRTLEVTLEAEGHGGAPVWPWIVGGAALAVGAGIGGYLLFKPSDTTNPVPAGGFAPTVKFASAGR